MCYKNIKFPRIVMGYTAHAIIYNKYFREKLIQRNNNNRYIFYSVADLLDSAWTDDDDKVILAMKKGLELVVTGQSSRGTVTNDNYTLKGFTAAFNKLNTECK